MNIYDKTDGVMLVIIMMAMAVMIVLMMMVIPKLSHKNYTRNTFTHTHFYTIFFLHKGLY